MQDKNKKIMQIEFTAEELKKNYEIYYTRQKMYKTYGYDIEKERLFIISVAEPVTGRVLEAGTGRGHMTLALAKKGYRFTTYDIDPDIQRIAMLNLAYAGVIDRVNFVIEREDRLSFKNSSFDIIFCVNTLHHLKKTAIVLDEFLRVLSNNGKLILSDFTEKTFEIMDKIHSAEGGTHKITGWDMDKAAKYLKDKGCNIREISDEYQEVFIITKVKR